MPSKAIIGLIQAHHDVDGGAPVEEHKKKAIEKHLRLIREAKQKARRSSACKSCSTGRTSAPSKTRSGMRLPSGFPTVQRHS